MTNWFYTNAEHLTIEQEQRLGKQLPSEFVLGQNRPYQLSGQDGYREMLKSVKPNDRIIFIDFDDMAHSWKSAKNILDYCRKRQIKVYIIKGHWNFNPTNVSDTSDYAKFESLYKFQEMCNVRKMNAAREKLSLKHGKYWHVGNMPRFLGPKKNYYIKVFKFASQYSEKQTAKRFHISTRTVARIKRDGEAYFNMPQRNRVK